MSRSCPAVAFGPPVDVLSVLIGCPADRRPEEPPGDRTRVLTNGPPLAQLRSDAKRHDLRAGGLDGVQSPALPRGDAVRSTRRMAACIVARRSTCIGRQRYKRVRDVRPEHPVTGDAHRDGTGCRDCQGDGASGSGGDQRRPAVDARLHRRDIVDQVGPAQSTVSQHLRILKASGLVHGTIDHPRICHALDPTALAPLRALLDAIAARHADGDAPCCYTPQGCVPRGTAP